MQTQSERTKILDFIPDENGNLIAVLMPSPFMEMIGTIEKEVDKQTGETRYFLTDESGNQIFPPAKNLQEAERKFEEYSWQLEDEKRNRREHGNTAEREDELRSIRQAKNEKGKQHNIDL